MADAGSDREGFGGLAFLVRAFQVSKMLQVAARLHLADRIQDGPRPVTELAAECGAEASMLLRLCRALAAFDVFTVDAQDRVGHSRRSAWLRSDASPTLHYAALYWTSPGNWAGWGNLEHAIRTGDSPFEAVFGQSSFAYLKAHPEEAALFDQFMQHSPDDRHAAVVEAYDFSRLRLVVDVGGGNGALLKAILSVNSQVEGIVYDQQAVVAAAEPLLSEAGLKGRYRLHAGDFFEEVPPGGDCYTLSQILHDWSDERCLTILRNCRAAIKPEGRLLVIERVLSEEPGRTNPMNFLADMHMMVLFDHAKERTITEFGRLFEQAGFCEPNVIPTRSPFCVIEAHPS